MEIRRIKNFHLKVSLILYIACLVFPAYYLGNDYEPQPPILILSSGWLGIFVGHFNWYANAFFLLALCTLNKTKLSLFFSFLSILLALEFLRHEIIVVDVTNSTTYETVSAYGIGYALWLSSIGFIFFGQLAKIYSKNDKYPLLASIAWVIVVTTIYTHYYFNADNSLYSIHSARNNAFKEKCLNAKQEIYKDVSGVKGVFFDSDYSIMFNKKPFGRWESSVTGRFGHSLVNMGVLSFFERRSESTKKSSSNEEIRYEIYELHDRRESEVSQLKSEFAVITNHYEFPDEYRIYGADVIIKNLISGETVATTSYIFNKDSGQFCGHSNKGYFSVSQFVIDALNLTKKYPSIYDK